MGDYLNWARAQGCSVRLSLATGDKTQGRRIAAIRHPSGAHVFEPFSEEADPLASTTVARLDRRLGLKSYLFV